MHTLIYILLYVDDVLFLYNLDYMQHLLMHNQDSTHFYMQGEPYISGAKLQISWY